MMDDRKTGAQLATIANNENLDITVRHEAANEYEARRLARCPGLDEDGERCIRFDLNCSDSPEQQHIRKDYRTWPR